MSNNYIRFNFTDSKEITIYPLVCMHIGAPQSDVKFLKEHIQRIKEDPTARWVYMGDGGECVTKHSKGDIFEQLMSPQAQLNMVTDLLEPIKAKGLFGIRGNHGHRVYKETGLGFDHTLSTRLGIPYLGVGAFANLVVNRSSYDLYFHHGTDSGTTLASKISKAEHFGKFINADAIFTAHSHVAMRLTPTPLLGCENIGKSVYTKLRHQYICGCAYDSRTGYAEDKGYPPLLPAYLSVSFSGKIIQGRPKHSQEHRVYASDGTYKLKHDYLLDYVAGRDE